jgi:hypothetical protein
MRPRMGGIARRRMTKRLAMAFGNGFERHWHVDSLRNTSARGARPPDEAVGKTGLVAQPRIYIALNAK